VSDCDEGLSSLVSADGVRMRLLGEQHRLERDLRKIEVDLKTTHEVLNNKDGFIEEQAEKLLKLHGFHRSCQVTL
jgi:hypothetical protein